MNAAAGFSTLLLVTRSPKTVYATVQGLVVVTILKSAADDSQ
jgi:hypothetical protein